MARAASKDDPAAPTSTSRDSEPWDSEVLVTSTFGTPEFMQAWADALRGQGLSVLVWDPDTTTQADLDRVEFAVVWNPPTGLLARCPRLKAIHSFGAGVSPSMLDNAVCPARVPLLRVIDPLMAQRMATFVLWAVINSQRKCPASLQQGLAVEQLQQVDNGDLRVGVMGAGQMGAATIRLLAAAGYCVSAWVRGSGGGGTRQLAPGVRCFKGPCQLRQFAGQANVVVCLVPLTDETWGILNANFFGWLPAGAHIINVSRGQLAVEADLLAALDGGQLAGAVLDVFQQEPLPPESPLWRHPRVRIFPHVSSIPHLTSGARQIARMRALVLGGQPLPAEAVVDRQRGY